MTKRAPISELTAEMTRRGLWSKRVAEQTEEEKAITRAYGAVTTERHRSDPEKRRQMYAREKRRRVRRTPGQLERERATARAYYARQQPEIRRKWKAYSRRVGLRWRRHNVTPEQAQWLLRRQGGVCAVDKETPLTLETAQIEHDHNCCPPTRRWSCGRCIRGLTCVRCNHFVGLVETYGFEMVLDYLSLPYVSFPKGLNGEE